MNNTIWLNFTEVFEGFTFSEKRLCEMDEHGNIKRSIIEEMREKALKEYKHFLKYGL